MILASGALETRIVWLMKPPTRWVHGVEDEKVMAGSSLCMTIVPGSAAAAYARVQKVNAVAPDCDAATHAGRSDAAALACALQREDKEEAGREIWVNPIQTKSGPLVLFSAPQIRGGSKPCFIFRPVVHMGH